MFNPKIIKCAQGGAGKVAKFRMVAFGLKFADHSDWNNDFMFFKSGHCPGICQEY